MKIINGWVQVNDGASVEVDKEIAINADATEDAFFIVVDDIVLRMNLGDVSDEIADAWERWVVE